MELILWLGLFLPLCGFLFIMLLNSYLPRRAVEIIGPDTILLSFSCFSYLLFQYTNGLYIPECVLFNWIPIKGLYTDFAVHLDHLALVMTLVITGVGFLIHAYSVGYMDHDTDVARFFSVMNFFIFSMLLLVLAADLLLFFIGWEGVGLASYLLIGFWYQKPSASKAAKKAFVVNRIGDLGLLLGILLTFYLFGTSNIQKVSVLVGKNFPMSAPIIILLAFLYFWGSCAKSAQIPLHTWLPDAMEGPTPVSALIHAATMVTAGVYLVARMHAVYHVAPEMLFIIGTVGAVTSLFAALCATSQTDLKRVLAYSTVSQLGLMFLACGSGAYFAALFHLTTHAFVKALLFLSAGNVIHMMHGTTEMSKMGGLEKCLPKTNILFLIGVLSMAGIPPLAIFFSKDLILEGVASSKFFYYTGLSISLLTAFYLTRAYVLTFKGPCTASVKEAPVVMIFPVAVLGILAIVGGLLGFSINKPPILMNFLAKDSPEFISKELALGFHFSFGIWVSIIVAVTGVVLAAVLFSRYRSDKLCSFFYKAFYINELYNALVVIPMRSISRLIARIFEPKLFDTSLKIAVNASQKTASLLQVIQSGQIRSYIAWIAFGASILLIFLVFEGV